MTRVSFIWLLALTTLLFSGALAHAQAEVIHGPVTRAVLERGRLNCGANAHLVGFGSVNAVGLYEGFDVDICRAVAVALLGDANAVAFRPLVGAERQAALQGGEVDMMSRNTTWTLSRDAVWGAIFGPTTFYDGQGIGTRAEYGVAGIEELDGASICVGQGLHDRVEHHRRRRRARAGNHHPRLSRRHLHLAGLP